MAIILYNRLNEVASFSDFTDYHQGAQNNLICYCILYGVWWIYTLKSIIYIFLTYFLILCLFLNIFYIIWIFIWIIRVCQSCDSVAPPLILPHHSREGHVLWGANHRMLPCLNLVWNYFHSITGWKLSQRGDMTFSVTHWQLILPLMPSRSL